jgi:hypothetical protein
MTLEKLAFAIMWKHRDAPLTYAKAAWSVWTMRGTWKATEFADHYEECCTICGCDLTGHA